MAIFKCLILLFIISCTHLPTKQYPINIDNYKHDYPLQQYNTSLEINEPAIPEIMPLPIEFPDLTISNQLISINVSEEVSVKDLLIEIGKLSDVNLDMDPKISGNIILKLKDKDINEVIQSIANSAKLRYSTSNGVIRIEQDLPYAQNYYVDFINIQHSAQSSFVINNTNSHCCPVK